MTEEQKGIILMAVNDALNVFMAERKIDVLNHAINIFVNDFGDRALVENAAEIVKIVYSDKRIKDIEE